MERVNQSLVTEFLLLGFSMPPRMSLILFVLFLIIYLFTLTANSLIITVIYRDSRLHSPMYFFLVNLSFLDLCYLTTTVPTCLKGFISKLNTITFAGCIAQMLIGLSLGATQCVLLAVMACDRYVAICNPLNYHRLLNNYNCIKLSISTWSSGILLSVVQMHYLMTVPFCGQNKINHVVCEVAAFLRLACTDIHLFEAVILMVSVVFLVAPMSLILFTYLRIISTVLTMSAAGRRKAFSTCSSHLLVVVLFYGVAITIYMRPRTIDSIESDKVISLFYGLVTPALNPLIYTLRNTEVKGAMKNLLCTNNLKITQC
ncbi:olfactory receptor 2D3-like [Ambystoma mexicanum]|uniref:olfactory receptor 2D3-like n=1 Tax=Ambystoma mexicanum TaxID=8296 RepID=UPI0037E9B96D